MGQGLPRRLEQLPAVHRAEALRQLGASATQPPPSPTATASRPRIRQRTKPISNALETEFGRILRIIPGAMVWEKGFTLRLANGCTYTPDWACLLNGVLQFHEVKGEKAWDDAIVKLKVAAATFPCFEFYLQDKPYATAHWREQRVLP